MLRALFPLGSQREKGRMGSSLNGLSWNLRSCIIWTSHVSACFSDKCCSVNNKLNEDPEYSLFLVFPEFQRILSLRLCLTWHGIYRPPGNSVALQTLSPFCFLPLSPTSLTSSFLVRARCPGRPFPVFSRPKKTWCAPLSAFSRGANSPVLGTGVSTNSAESVNNLWGV